MKCKENSKKTSPFSGDANPMQDAMFGLSNLMARYLWDFFFFFNFFGCISISEFKGLRVAWSAQSYLLSKLRSHSARIRTHLLAIMNMFY